MNRKAQLAVIGVGAAAGVWGIARAGKKRINTLPYGYGIKMKKAVSVNAPAERLFSFWRDLENLPTLSANLLSVKTINSTISHWKLSIPGLKPLEWNAEITVDRRNEMIGWRSLVGADLDNAGYVRFERATGGPGTVVRIALQYNPPAGKLGAAVSTMLGQKPETQVEEALRKFKQLMESGEIATVTEETKLPHSSEPVEAASEDSFPASDAPAWTGTTGSTG